MFCHQLDVLSIFSFINLLFHQLCISLNWCLINLWFHQLALPSTCSFINFLRHKLFILSTRYFINLLWYQLEILSTWDFINLPFYQLVILSFNHDFLGGRRAFDEAKSRRRQWRHRRVATQLDVDATLVFQTSQGGTVEQQRSKLISVERTGIFFFVWQTSVPGTNG